MSRIYGFLVSQDLSYRKEIMKKILEVMILGLFWCNVIFADLILFCKQEVRLINVTRLNLP